MQTEAYSNLSQFDVKHVQKVRDGYMRGNAQQGFNKMMYAVACDANTFENLLQSTYDVVLCNGVSMYFPSFFRVMNYFDGVLDRCHDRGAVILCDVRSMHYSPRCYCVD